MTKVLADYHVNGSSVHCDPGRQTVSLTAWPFTLTFSPDEARRLHDELGAALAGLAVKDSALAEVDRG